MEFYDFNSSYDWTRKQGLADDVTPKQFYDEIANITLRAALVGGPEGFRAENNRMIGEGLWYDNGCPYYKVFPGVIGLLSNVGINIPIEYLKLPFTSFLIRLPKEDNPFPVFDRQIRSIMVMEGKPVFEPDNLHRVERQIILFMDCGELDPVGAPVLCYHNMDGSPGKTIDEIAFALPNSARSPTDLTHEQTEQILRIAVSVAFLATGSDKLISPDVLSKDLSDWLEAVRKRDEERRGVIEQRAVRRGKKGWNVGVGERHFLRPRQPSHDGDGTGRELSYQHQRSCHFRTLPSEKVIFIRQMTIRADLPTKAANV